MIVTSATLTALRTGFSKHFQDGQNGVEPQFLKIASVIPSTTATNTYGWLGEWPGFREWIGDRVHKSMKERDYTIANKDWESSVDVQRNHIEDDQLGIYDPMFKEAGRATKLFPDELVFPILGLGETTTCYDGQYFFDTDHPVNAEVDGSGADTSVKNMIVDGAYTGDTWYMMCTSRALKPIIYQERKKPQFTAMTALTDEAVYLNKTFRYGIDLRSNAGFGFWQMAIAIKAAPTPDVIWEAIELMKSYTADGGRKLGLVPDLIVAPSTLEKTLTRILERELYEENGVAITNELKGKFELLEAHQL
jgi:phage major head subunit gpT-like protein